MRLNRDANCFFPVEREDCMKSASYEYRKMSARSGAQFVPIGMPNVCWKLFRQKPRKILSTRNSSILMMLSSEYSFLESDCSFTKYVSSCPNTKYLYLRLPFFKLLCQDAVVMSLADKCIIVGCVVYGGYDKILMETGKFSDNINVT